MVGVRLKLLKAMSSRSRRSYLKLLADTSRSKVELEYKWPLSPIMHILLAISPEGRYGRVPSTPLSNVI